MSEGGDDRFQPDAADSGGVYPEPHQITMMALVPLVWDGHHWRIQHPAELIPDVPVCNRGNHLHDGLTALDRCMLERERAMGEPLPSRGATRDAFDHANRVRIS